MKPLTSAEEDMFKVSTPAGKGADRQRPLSVVFVGREAAPEDDAPGGKDSREADLFGGNAVGISSG